MLVMVAAVYDLIFTFKIETYNLFMQQKYILNPNFSTFPTTDDFGIFLDIQAMDAHHFSFL